MDDFGINILAAILTIGLLALVVMATLGEVLGEYGIIGPGYWHSVAIAATLRFAAMN